MVRFTLTNIYALFMLIITITIGPIIFMAPFVQSARITLYHTTEFSFGLFDYKVVAPASASLIIAGFVISLLTIINLFDYNPKTAKIPYWLHRLLRLFPLIGSDLGIAGTLLKLRVYFNLIALGEYDAVKLSIGFYVSLVLFSIIFVGTMIQIIVEELTQQKWIHSEIRKADLMQT